MSISNSTVSASPLADGAASADAGKTKGPPAKRQMTALADIRLTPEAR